MDKAISNYLADLRAAGRAPTTLASYEQTLRAFCRYLSGCKIRHPRQVRPDHARAYLITLRETGDKSSTVRHQAIVMACFFNWLIRQGQLRTTPMQAVTRPKIMPSGRKPLAQAEVVAMLAVASRTHKATRNVAILYLLLDCGLRASELLAIRPSDYHLGTLAIHGKGSKVRSVAMGQRCKAAFEQYLAERDGDLWRLTRKGLEALVGRLGQQVGIASFPHQWRHTFATHFLDAGGNIDELQILLGHSSITTTMIYARAGQEARALRSHVVHSPADNLPLI